MKQTLKILLLTIFIFIAMDVLISFTLKIFERHNRLPGIVQYFEYGYSVPKKMENWEKNYSQWYDLTLENSLRDDALQTSQKEFLSENPDQGPVIRVYGMSFVDQIVDEAMEIRPKTLFPNLKADKHSSAGAPPNYSFMIYNSDRENRNRGDIAILGILSSSVLAMNSMSNSAWSFEHPLPFTYPIYWPEEQGLRTIEPLIYSRRDVVSLSTDTSFRKKWYDQLRRHDAYFTSVAFAFPWMDVSPFVRLIRRWNVTSRFEKLSAKGIEKSAYPYKEVLNEFVVNFAETARSDGQIPIVFLIQARPTDVDLKNLLQAKLEDHNIRYFATIDHFNPTDPTGFVKDGHFKKHINAMLAENFLVMLLQDLKD